MVASPADMVDAPFWIVFQGPRPVRESDVEERPSLSSLAPGSAMLTKYIVPLTRCCKPQSTDPVERSSRVEVSS